MNEIKLKQYVICPRKPRMSKGKLCSQVAHATFMALEKQRKLDDKSNLSINTNEVQINDWKESNKPYRLECNIDYLRANNWIIVEEKRTLSSMKDEYIDGDESKPMYHPEDVKEFIKIVRRRIIGVGLDVVKLEKIETILDEEAGNDLI